MDFFFNIPPLAFTKYKFLYINLRKTVHLVMFFCSLTESFPKRIPLVEILYIKKEHPKGVLFLYGTPKRIRIAVYTVKGLL